jgi:hypothetical protein
VSGTTRWSDLGRGSAWAFVTGVAESGVLSLQGAVLPCTCVAGLLCSVGVRVSFGLHLVSPVRLLCRCENAS